MLKYLLISLLFINISMAQFAGVDAIKKNADGGDQFSQLLIGLLYKKGQGIKQDFVQARNYFAMSAEQGNVEAQFELGFMYQNGYGYRQSYSKAAEQYRKAVVGGEQRSVYYLAKLIREKRIKRHKTESSSKMFAQAWEYFNEQNEKGDPESFYFLGKMKFNGWGTEPSAHKALEYFKKGAAVQEANCIYEKALFYLKGMIVKADAELALEYLDDAIDDHSIDAVKTKLEIARAGNSRLNLFPNRELMLKLEKDLADMGVSQYQYIYAMRLKSLDMKSFRLEGKFYLINSADQQWIESEFELGQILLFGKYGIEQNLPAGKKYIISAAEEGHPKAKRLLHEIKKHSGQ